MGTRWSVTVEADTHTGAHIDLDWDALRHELAAAVQQVDEQMSPWNPDSDLVRLNRAPIGVWVDLPAEMLEVLGCALDIHHQSAGAFDPCVGALVDAWGFGAARDAPDAEAINTARQAALCTLQQSLELDHATGRARKCAPLQVDLCGIAKGYGVDRMVAVLQQHRVRHALTAIDGELRAVGGQASGAPWAVALESPDIERRAAHGVIELQDLAVATSGDYRHFLNVGGAHLAHSMDPRRGAPVNNGVASVTVLARTSMAADAWATALLVAGPGEGLAMAQRLGLEALFLLRRPEGLVEVGLGRFSG